MDLRDSWTRLIVRHRRLIAACCALGILGAGAVIYFQSPRYTATARLLLASSQPQSDVAAAAIVDEAKALAASPTLVSAAIAAAQVNRSATSVAAHDVAVSGLGSSSVVDLSVTDADATVATSLTAALGRQVVNNINASPAAALTPVLAQLTKETTSLTAQRNNLITRIAARPSTQHAVALNAALDGVIAQLAQTSTARQQLLAQPADQATAQVIGQPSHATLVSRHLPQYLGLGIILGLAVGILISAVLEVIRPTAPSARSVALELGTTVLNAPDRKRDLQDTAAMIRFGAARCDVRTVVLAGPFSERHLTALATRLATAIERHSHPAGLSEPTRTLTDRLQRAPEPALARGGAASWLPMSPKARWPSPPPDTSTETTGREAFADGPIDLWRPLVVVTVGALDVGDGSPRTPGVVLAVSSPIARRRLESAEALLSATGWPLLGVWDVDEKWSEQVANQLSTS